MVSFIDRISCVGFCDRIASVLRSPNGHKMLVTSGVANLPIVFCGTCGANSAVWFEKLTSACLGKPCVIPKSLKCLFAVPSVHPATGERLERPYPVEQDDPRLQIG